MTNKEKLDRCIRWREQFDNRDEDLVFPDIIWPSADSDCFFIQSLPEKKASKNAMERFLDFIRGTK